MNLLGLQLAIQTLNDYALLVQLNQVFTGRQWKHQLRCGIRLQFYESDNASGELGARGDEYV
jgi:hypothetical protein